jgi:hypothetical protein
MLSVIIATGGIEQPTVATLAALVPGAASGLIRDVLLVDGTNNGVIERVADVAGCRFVNVESATQAGALAAGATLARSPWLMFLHAGAVLEAGWIEETSHFMRSVAESGRDRAAVFRYARSPYRDLTPADVLGFVTRKLFGPRADQGLLISREHYEKAGGYTSHAGRSHLLRRSSPILLRSKIVMFA